VGPDWLAEDYGCTAGGDFKLRLTATVASGWFGALGPAHTESGVFEVRGHYDDAQSARCRFTDSATPLPPEPLRNQQAVMFCREEFVVTHLDPRPITDMAALGSAFALWVDCADKSVDFAGQRWAADPESFANWRPSSSPAVDGRMEVLSADQARFIDHGGTELLFDRITDETVPLCGP
jgi:hypothetical protein